MEFSEKLKELRKKKNLTQTELANQIYVSRSVIAKYESGSAKPNKENVQKLAQFFNVQPNDLYDSGTTTLSVIENDHMKEMLKESLLICSIIICVAFVIFSFIPVVPIREYVYPEGGAIYYVENLKSPVLVITSHNNPLCIILISLCVLESVLSLFCLTLLKNKLFIFRLLAYIFFILIVFLIFLTVIFCFEYSH